MPELGTLIETNARTATEWGLSSSVAFHQPVWNPVPESRVTVQVSRDVSRQTWFSLTRARLEELLALGPNWNGYGEQPIHPASVKRVVGILQGAGYTGQAPTIVPLASGGLQLEWSNGATDLEVEVLPQGAAHAFVFVGDDQESWDIDSTAGVERFAAALHEVIEA